MFFIVLINNAYYGFGWTDEALYIATANSLYHGNRLFFDIFEPTQIYSVLVYPLFYIFVKLTSSTDGIYLFMRIATITIQFATSVFVFFILSKKYRKEESFLASCILLGTMFLIFVLKNGDLKEFPAALTYFFSSPEYSSKTTLLKIKWLLKFPRLLVTQFIYFLPFTVLAVISFFKKNIKEKINFAKNKTILLLLLFVNYIIQILFIEKDNGMPVTGFFAVSVLSFFLFNSNSARNRNLLIIEFYSL